MYMYVVHNGTGSEYTVKGVLSSKLLLLVRYGCQGHCSNQWPTIKLRIDFIF